MLQRESTAGLARHAASIGILEKIQLKNFAENVETDQPRIANCSHTPYRLVRVVPEGHMAHDRINDEVAVVLVFVVPRLAREPGGSVHGQRANFTGLVLGCIDADFCK